ncbi:MULTISPECIES: TonB-dependent receptor domain-containing protein [Myroides]|uniref:TonB-dependent receptor domain-containing protein n=1 Tax=Myroides TaxID=76831 RepID=UPI000280ABF1|nr:TonB-dependent receptor [Myroides odoratimimus]EKB06024.1 hypothetical protein HMPREF9711_00880 [Myroides odoratimimus CCUG 3837]
MEKKYFVTLFFLLVSIFIFGQAPSKNNRQTLVIKVENEELKPIAYATIAFSSLNSDITTNHKGEASIKLPLGTYDCSISALGYFTQEKRIEITPTTKIVTIQLIRESIVLEEFIIMAKYDKKTGSEATIGQSALTYIQPTSIVDAMVLLPGSLYQPTSLNQFNGVSFRQSGKDSNSSLGVSVVSNGVAMNNDGSRNQLYGITAGSNPSYAKERNLVFNSGLDMRMISTDHIESMSITRGISSAKQGNLSSGQINLNAKQGVTPIQLRAKVDPDVQLAYIGKGIDLGTKAGALHLGMDILSSKPDVRESLTKFTRLTTQANHTLTTEILQQPFDINTKLNYTQTLDNHKSDQSTEYNEEVYKVKYQKLDLTWKASTWLNKSWIDKLEFLSHLDYTIDVLDRSLMVYSDGGVNMSNTTEPGVHEAHYLPSKYKTSYQMDNAPLNVFLQLNAGKYLNLSKHISQQISYGVEYNSSKNYGKGAVVDPNLPPFPTDNAFIRPRKNSAIPALVHTAYYLESNIDIEMPKLFSTMELSTGVRGVQMYNLPDNYYLKKKVLLEPRVQMNFKTYYNQQNNISSNIRIGFGQQNKLPTLDYLYPDRIYRDIEVLNWYDNNPEHRLLLTQTSLHEVENPNLKASKTTKLEVGVDFSIQDFELSLTGFKEDSSGGFDYHYQYSPINYTKFTKPQHPVVGRPDKNDFLTEDKYSFIMLPQVRNSSTVEKKGIEYRLVFPKINPINTTVEVNGAYYQTEYSSNQPKMFYPKTLINTEVYPYVGIYDKARSVTLSRFNTNLWINTRIPKLKLIFTTFIQALWYSSSQLSRSESFKPSAYLDHTAQVHQIDFDSSVDQDKQLLPLDLTSEKTNFAKDKTKPDFTVNFKGTKEFKHFGSVSFFVNHIVNVNSKYKNNYNVNQRKWTSPYFGIEVTLKLDKK